MSEDLERNLKSMKNQLEQAWLRIPIGINASTSALSIIQMGTRLPPVPMLWKSTLKGTGAALKQCVPIKRAHWFDDEVFVSPPKGPRG